MPLPIPNKNESEKEFISRCMSNDIMKKEFSDNKQRIAVCYSQFEKNESYQELKNNIINRINKYLNKKE